MILERERVVAASMPWGRLAPFADSLPDLGSRDARLGLRHGRALGRRARAAALVVIACTSASLGAAAARAPWPDGLLVYDHVVIVVEENKDYEELIGSPAAPYLDALRAEGASFTQMYAEEHYSEGNYFWLFSGSNQGVGFSDRVPTEPITASNLGAELIRSGRSFKGYSEDLPNIGSTEHFAGLYTRGHVPWISFGNVPNGSSPSDSSNLQWRNFPADYSTLPTVSFVIPNLVHDMHEGSIPGNIAAGDAWLRTHLDSYLRWARQHDSLLIVTFDESHHGIDGPTDPAAPEWEMRNRIPTLFCGAHVRHGAYAEGAGITHVNILRTLESMYGLPRSGAQQPNALRAGIADDLIVTDVFDALPTGRAHPDSSGRPPRHGRRSVSP